MHHSTVSHYYHLISFNLFNQKLLPIAKLATSSSHVTCISYFRLSKVSHGLRNTLTNPVELPVRTAFFWIEVHNIHQHSGGTNNIWDFPRWHPYTNWTFTDFGLTTQHCITQMLHHGCFQHPNCKNGKIGKGRKNTSFNASSQHIHHLPGCSITKLRKINMSAGDSFLMFPLPTSPNYIYPPCTSRCHGEDSLVQHGSVAPGMRLWRLESAESSRPNVSNPPIMPATQTHKNVRFFWRILGLHHNCLMNPHLKFCSPTLNWIVSALWHFDQKATHWRNENSPIPTGIASKHSSNNRFQIILNHRYGLNKFVLRRYHHDVN